jgi:hypothetical protein
MLAPFLPALRWLPEFLQDPLGVIFSRERHLVYPTTRGERRAVLAAPNSYYNQLPTHYAWGDIELDRGLLDDLTRLTDNGSVPEGTLNNVVAGRTLGNAVDLSSVLYEHWFLDENLPDFNLDGDRGYAYLCWTQNINGAEPPNLPQKLITHVDDPFPPEVMLEFIAR